MLASLGLLVVASGLYLWEISVSGARGWSISPRRADFDACAQQVLATTSLPDAGPDGQFSTADDPALRADFPQPSQPPVSLGGIPVSGARFVSEVLLVEHAHLPIFTTTGYAYLPAGQLPTSLANSQFHALGGNWYAYSFSI